MKQTSLIGIVALVAMIMAVSVVVGCESKTTKSDIVADGDSNETIVDTESGDNADSESVISEVESDATNDVAIPCVSGALACMYDDAFASNYWQARCSADGHWVRLTDCRREAKVCQAGECVSPNSSDGDFEIAEEETAEVIEEIDTADGDLAEEAIAETEEAGCTDGTRECAMDAEYVRECRNGSWVYTQCTTAHTCIAGECVVLVDGDTAEDEVEEVVETAEESVEEAMDTTEPAMEETVDLVEEADTVETTDTTEQEQIVCTKKCDDLLPCMVGTCAFRVVASGLEAYCDYNFAPTGTACDDGNLCTKRDVCESGVCVGKDEVVCSVPGQCQEAGVCDSFTGTCVFMPKINGTACADGNGCTQGDTCQKGECVSGKVVDCSTKDGQCVVGRCFSDKEASYMCGTVPRADNIACDDGNLCTKHDTCQAGECKGGDSVICAAPDQCHEGGVCDPNSGACNYKSKTNGTACNDGSACTTGDVCFNGTCAGTPVVCDDKNSCTTDTCDVVKGCVFAPNANSCDDGNACTTGDRCEAGQCKGATLSCDDGNLCTTDMCDVKTGCQHVNNNNPCDDSTYCTVNDVCTAGQCKGTPRDCSAAGDACNAGVCDEFGMACVKNPTPKNGMACDADSSGCTVGDTCVAGKCMPGPTPDCSAAGDQCNKGICISKSADKYVCGKDPTVLEGTACTDGTYCTVGETCHNGLCSNGKARDCSFLNDACNTGACDEGMGACKTNPKPDTTTCDDGAFCTVGDHCKAGACVGGGAKDCTASGDQCNTGVCDESSDTCVKDPQPKNNTTCNADESGCTMNDKCVSGKCVAGPLADCKALTDQCNIGLCYSTTFSTYLCVADKNTKNGADCDDGLFCTIADKCSSGQCLGTPRDCTTGRSDQCNNGACNEVSNQCETLPKPNGIACDDNNPCTTGDFCQSGACTGIPKVCAVPDQCHMALGCSKQTGMCEEAAKPNGATCDDANACTVGDVCLGGICASGNSPCQQGQVCHQMNPGFICVDCWSDSDCSTGFACLHNVCTSKNCDDHNACTQDSWIDGWGCVNYDISSMCNDHNDCTTDYCDSKTGCQHLNNTNPCEGDNNLCTADECRNGACRFDHFTDCSDNNGNTVDVCNPATGACTHDPVEVETTDGDADSEAEVESELVSEESEPSAEESSDIVEEVEATDGDLDNISESEETAETEETLTESDAEGGESESEGDSESSELPESLTQIISCGAATDCPTVPLYEKYCGPDKACVFTGVNICGTFEVLIPQTTTVNEDDFWGQYAPPNATLERIVPDANCVSNGRCTSESFTGTNVYVMDSSAGACSQTVDWPKRWQSVQDGTFPAGAPTGWCRYPDGHTVSWHVLNASTGAYGCKHDD